MRWGSPLVIFVVNTFSKPRADGNAPRGLGIFLSFVALHSLGLSTARKPGGCVTHLCACTLVASGHIIRFIVKGSPTFTHHGFEGKHGRNWTLPCLENNGRRMEELLCGHYSSAPRNV